MKKLTPCLILILFSIFNPLHAQKLYDGVRHTLNPKNYIKFKYSVQYKENGNVFETLYTIYHPNTRIYASNVVAIHYKDEKKVKVTVKDGDGIFNIIAKEETSYQIPSMEYFGNSGATMRIFDSNALDPLMIRFLSKKFENVVVTFISISPPDSFNFEYLILSK